MNKEEKTAKILSDGTTAKVGMLVIHTTGDFNGNHIGTVTKITALNDSYHQRKGYPNRVCVEAIDLQCTSGATHHSELGTKIPSWEEDLLNLRKATPTERRQYYANKFSK